MSTLHIKLFGNISIERNGQAISNLYSKNLELFCYLLLHRKQTHTRESLASLLWPDVPTTQAKKYLRQTIWRLQTALGDPNSEEGDEANRLFVHDPGWVRINTEAAWQMDVAVFEQAYDLCRDLPGHTLSNSQAEDLQEAIQLYRGDLLNMWYEDWCIYERERLQLIYLTMLDKLMGYCEAHQRYEEGVDYGTRILRLDRAREGTYRQLMRLYYRAGHRTAALREYDRCKTVLAEELAIEPTEETTFLYAQIRADRLDAIASTRPKPEASSNAGDGTEVGVALGLVRQLEQIQQDLTIIKQSLNLT